MNEAELWYADRLNLLQHAGEIKYYAYEEDKLRIADGCFYTPDYTVILQPKNGDGIKLEYHEVKGHMREAARVRIRTAASQRPWARFIIQWVKKNSLRGGEWYIEKSEVVPCTPLVP